jgi:hypothetical protein
MQNLKFQNILLSLAAIIFFLHARTSIWPRTPHNQIELRDI